MTSTDGSVISGVSVLRPRIGVCLGIVPPIYPLTVCQQAVADGVKKPSAFGVHLARLRLLMSIVHQPRPIQLFVGAVSLISITFLSSRGGFPRLRAAQFLVLSCFCQAFALRPLEPVIRLKRHWLC